MNKPHNMNSRFIRAALLACLCAALLLAAATCTTERAAEPADHRAAARIALDWNDLLLELERHTPGYRPPVSSRAFAYIEMAAYEAALPALEGYFSLTNLCPGYQPAVLPTEGRYHLPVALNAAYAHILRKFFPTAPGKVLGKITALEAAHQKAGAGEVDAAIAQQSTQFGRAVAEAVWQFSVLDSAGHDGFLYNYDRSFSTCAEVGCWQPDADRPMPALLPHWSDVRPFFVKTHDIRAKPPVVFEEKPGSAFHTEAMEVFSVSQARSKEDLWIAEFWSDDLPGLTITPVGRWMSITNQSLEQAALPFPEMMETYLKTAWALCDASIVCWEAKYRYQLERPGQYIRRNIQSDWSPLHDSPSFPSYPSGHAAFGAAAAEVLAAQLGSQFALTDRTHEGRDEFASQPRHFESFEAMAQENAFSRLLMGVHYRMDCEEGLRLGKAVGQKMRVLPLRWSEAGVSRR